jgi:hypothetical protein
VSLSQFSRVDDDRRPSPRHVEEPEIALVHDDIYAVLAPTRTLGFVQRVGNTFVALEGPDLARACEVGQSLSWDEAVAMVCRAARSRA